MTRTTSSDPVEVAHQGDAIERWLAALHDLTRTPEATSLYQAARTRFATLVAQQLLTATRVQKDDPIVYGVWLDGHSAPIYIGQTLQGQRRVWDLPIGESHHLANTFPPEIWKRVVVVRWVDLLMTSATKMQTLLADMQQRHPKFKPQETISLILERGLQRHFAPLFNASRRQRTGERRPVDLLRATGRPTTSTAELVWLANQVLACWNDLAGDEPASEISRSADFGGVVYPSLMLLALRREQE